MTDQPDQPERFVCPRCGDPLDQRYYGPCLNCREELRHLEPPEPDPRFRESEKADGSRIMVFTG